MCFLWLTSAQVQSLDSWPAAFAHVPMCNTIRLLVLTVPVQRATLSPCCVLPCVDRSHLAVLDLLVRSLPTSVMCVRFVFALRPPVLSPNPVSVIRRALPWIHFAANLADRPHIQAIGFAVQALCCAPVAWSELEDAFICQPFVGFTETQGSYIPLLSGLSAC